MGMKNPEREKIRKTEAFKKAEAIRLADKSQTRIAEPKGPKFPTKYLKRGSDWVNMGVSTFESDEAAKKAARVAAIKAAALNNKKYNVGTSTTADLNSVSPVSGILSGGGGGGYYTEGTSGGGFSFSDIPSVVWIILAVGAGWFLIKSSKGKGK